MKKVWKIIKYIAYLVALVAVVTLIVGSIMSKTPSAMKKVIWNDKLYDVCESEGGLRVWYIPEYEGSYVTDERSFNFSCVRYCPDAGQWQLTVGCNDSTVARLAEKRGIELDAEEENFVYILRDGDDNIYAEYDELYRHSARHGFRRLIFDGIPKNGVSKLTLCIYFKGDVTDGVLPEKPLDAATIYSSALVLKEWDGDDIQAPPEEKVETEHIVVNSEFGIRN